MRAQLSGHVISVPQFPESSPMYALFYFYQIFKNIVHVHKTNLLYRQSPLMSEFLFTEDIKNEWYDFFGVDRTSLYIPFSYFSKQSVFALLKLFEGFDLNMKDLFHISSKRWFNPKIAGFQVGETYKIYYEVKDIIKFAVDRIAFIGLMSTYDKHEQLITTNEEVFSISHISKDAIRSLDRLSHHHHTDASQFRGLSKKTSVLKNRSGKHNMIELKIPDNMGKAYGAVSGDLNPLHTSKYFAKLIGAETAFIQGLCGFNYALSQLTVRENQQIEDIEMWYCRHIYVGQRVWLQYAAGDFEMVDEENNVLACGHYAHRTSTHS